MQDEIWWEMSVLGVTCWLGSSGSGQAQIHCFLPVRDRELRRWRKAHGGYLSTLTEQAMDSRTAETHLTKN